MIDLLFGQLPPMEAIADQIEEINVLTADQMNEINDLTAAQEDMMRGLGDGIRAVSTDVDALAGSYLNLVFQLAAATQAGGTLADFLRDNLYPAQRAMGVAFEMIGQSIVDLISGQKTLGEVVINVIQSILRALGWELAARTALLIITGRWAAAAVAAAASIAAFVAAAALSLIKFPDTGTTSTTTTTDWPATVPGGGGAGGIGSTTTIQRAPDIYLTIHIENIYGAGGAEQAGMDIARVLREHALAGGQIFIQEAIAPIAGV